MPDMPDAAVFIPRACPPWVNQAQFKLKARNRFWIKLAACHHNPQGSIERLSQALGLGANTLATTLGRDAPLSAELCIKLETLLGRDVVQRETLCPEIFQIPA